MPDETKANETVVTNPQGEPTVTVADTTDWKAEHDKLQANYQSMQKNLSQRETKLRELEAKVSNVDGLKTLIDEIRENQALTLDEIDRIKRGEQILEETNVPVKVSRLDQLKAKKKEESIMQQAYSDLQEALVAAEIDSQDAELIEEVYKKSHNPQEALKNLPSFISKRAKKLVQEQVKVELEKSKELKKEEVKSSGALAVGVTSSTKAELDEKEFLSRFSTGELKFTQSNLDRYNKIIKGE